MLPGFKALKLYKGDTFAFRLTLSATGDDYDISNYEFIAQIKEKGKSTKVAEFTYSIEDGPGGQLLLVLSATEAAKLNPTKKYEYDVQMDNDGIISTILNGPIIVVRDISS